MKVTFTFSVELSPEFARHLQDAPAPVLIEDCRMILDQMPVQLKVATVRKVETFPEGPPRPDVVIKGLFEPVHSS